MGMFFWRRSEEDEKEVSQPTYTFGYSCRDMFATPEELAKKQKEQDAADLKILKLNERDEHDGKAVKAKHFYIRESWDGVTVRSRTEEEPADLCGWTDEVAQAVADKLTELAEARAARDAEDD